MDVLALRATSATQMAFTNGWRATSHRAYLKTDPQFMFNPNEYRNQHYVSEFWQRRFAGPDGNLYIKKNGKVTVGAARNQMSGDWIYTTFDDYWRPSNRLENTSGELEADAALAFCAMDAPNAVGTIEEQLIVRWFVAFSACRHPDTMSMGHRRGKDLAYVLADAHTMTVEQFSDALERFGQPRETAALYHSALVQRLPGDLLNQATEVEGMSPNDPRLNQQIALSDESVIAVMLRLAYHSVTIIDAPQIPFILGDTPFSVGLEAGFTLPVSSELALLWTPGASEKFQHFTRRPASLSEVDMSNRTQCENSFATTIGPSKAILEKYV